MQHSAENLIQESCSFFQLKKEEVFNPCRKRPLVELRHLITYVVKELFKTEEIKPYSEKHLKYGKPRGKRKISDQKVADLTGRTQPNVTNSYCQTKVLLEIDKEFKAKHDNLVKHLIANGWEGMDKS